MIPARLVSHAIILLRYWFTCLSFPIVSAAGGAGGAGAADWWERLGEACDPSADTCPSGSSCQNVTWLYYDYDTNYGTPGSEHIYGNDYYTDQVEGNMCAIDSW